MKPKKQKSVFRVSGSTPQEPSPPLPDFSEFTSKFFSEGPELLSKMNKHLQELFIGGETRLMNSYEMKTLQRKHATVSLMQLWVWQHGYPVRVRHDGKSCELNTWQQCLDYVWKREVPS